MKRLLILLAAMAIVLPACTNDDNTETTPCTHTSWQEGVCTDCGEECSHTWSDGVCTVCGTICSHPTIEDGICKVCGKYLYVIDGTLGGKTEATEEDITTLMEQLKTYVDNGLTTIIVTGSQPALIDMGSWINTAIGEAIYRLSKEESYDGKIDLILPDVTEIVDQEFDGAHALNSINLPKVTIVGDGAFYDCQYLEELTFGSVVTAINQNTRVVFHRVGEKVEGCDLVLNCGQAGENSPYIPDFTANTWYDANNKFKSITLTHTGENSECDECKANQ